MFSGQKSVFACVFCGKQEIVENALRHSHASSVRCDPGRSRMFSRAPPSGSKCRFGKWSTTVLFCAPRRNGIAQIKEMFVRCGVALRVSVETGREGIFRRLVYTTLT